MSKLTHGQKNLRRRLAELEARSARWEGRPQLPVTLDNRRLPRASCYRLRGDHACSHGEVNELDGAYGAADGAGAGSTRMMAIMP